MSANNMRKLVMVSAIGAVLTAGACSPIENTHGYLPVSADIAAIAPGTDNKDSILSRFGEPTSEGVQGDNSWYYVSYRVRELAFLKPKITERQILAITFDSRGKVSDINRYALENGVLINLNNRETVTGGRRITFLQQLLGNVGNFSAENFL